MITYYRNRYWLNILVLMPLMLSFHTVYASNSYKIEEENSNHLSQVNSYRQDLFTSENSNHLSQVDSHLTNEKFNHYKMSRELSALEHFQFYTHIASLDDEQRCISDKDIEQYIVKNYDGEVDAAYKHITPFFYGESSQSNNAVEAKLEELKLLITSYFNNYNSVEGDKSRSLSKANDQGVMALFHAKFLKDGKSVEARSFITHSADYGAQRQKITEYAGEDYASYTSSLRSDYDFTGIDGGSYKISSHGQVSTPHAEAKGLALVLGYARNNKYDIESIEGYISAAACQKCNNLGKPIYAIKHGTTTLYPQSIKQDKPNIYQEYDGSQIKSFSHIKWTRDKQG